MKPEVALVHSFLILAVHLPHWTFATLDIVTLDIATLDIATLDIATLDITVLIRRIYRQSFFYVREIGIEYQIHLRQPIMHLFLWIIDPSSFHLNNCYYFLFKVASFETETNDKESIERHNGKLGINLICTVKMQTVFLDYMIFTSSDPLTISNSPRFGT